MAGKSFVFRFGDVEVREREFSIAKAGEVLAVEPKAFRVLLFLLRNPQKLITKEELLNAVWGDAAVTENSLTRSIALLRKLLGDEARDPRYIETVATVGYRWVSKLEVFEEGSEESQAAEKPAESKGARQEVGSRRRLRGWTLAGGGVLALLLAGAIWRLTRPLPPPRVSDYNELTHDGRDKSLFGTDGARLYLNAAYLGPARMPVSGGEMARIPIALPNPWIMGVSPDGSTLLVGSESGDRNSLWSVQELGSSVRHLADGDIVSAAISPDGKAVAYSTLTGDLDVIQSDGTGFRKLASVPTQIERGLGDRTSWSPDGSKIRFDRNYKIYEISPEGSGLHPLLEGWRPSAFQCCGEWSRDGQFFIFLSWDTPPRNFSLLPASQMWVLDERHSPLRRTAAPAQLTSGPTRWGWPVPGRDGKAIFAHGATLSGELVRYDAPSHQFQPYLGGISAEGVSFSPDGRFVAYVTFPEGILWKANRDGSNPVQLTDPPLYPMGPRWSPNGSQILFFAAQKWGEARMYLVPSQGGVPHRLLPDHEESMGQPDWSPDGRKIAFDTEDKTPGNPKHYIRILDVASNQIQTLPGEEWGPSWSPDGRFISATSGDGRDLMIFDPKAQRWSFIKKEADPVGWSRDGQFLSFLGWEDGVGYISRVRPAGGKPERILDLKGSKWAGVFGFWMDLDPEGAPLLLRSIGSNDLYALTLEEK